MIRRSTPLVAVFVVVTGLAATACAPAPPPGLTAADRTAINAAEQASVKAVNSNDWEAWTGRFTSDGVFMPPNGSAVQGHDQILAWAKSFPPAKGFAIDMPEIEGTATMAYGRGTYKLTIAPPGASDIQDSGKFMEIWVKQADGAWKVKRDIFNSDVPLPPPPVPMAPPPPPAKKK
jgi:uncharacterized protein (TIGR02246 family)